MSEDLPIQGRITNKAGRGDKPRYIRPVERQRMRPWLIAHLDSNDIPGLAWQNKREKVFRISWKHAANQCFNMQKDTNLFERWAVHTGRHHDSDHKRWKANFRCALNSLPDVVEHKDQGIKKGNNAFKVYRFLDEKETRVNKETKGKRKKEPPDGEAEEDTGYRDHSYAEYQLDGSDSIPRLEHLNLSTGLRLRDSDSEKLRPLQGHLDDPNLQEILAAATASLAAGSDAVSLEKISIEQLSRLGELSKMRLDIPQNIITSESCMYAYLCSWCDKVFPSKIEIFKHFLMAHQLKLLARDPYMPPAGPDTSDPKYQKLQKEIEVLEKQVFSFTRDTFQSSADEVENEEVVLITSNVDPENQALDLSVKSKGYQAEKQEVALDLSMNTLKKRKSPKTVQAKSTSKKRRSSLDIDYTVKFGNYGLAGTPRTKRQMSLHTRKKEEEEEKLAKKLSVEVENADAAGKHSVEDLVHAEILMSLKSGAGDEAESSNDSTSVKSKKEIGRGRKGKAAQKKHLINLERVIDDVAKRGADEEEEKSADETELEKKSDTKLKFKAFRCGLCLQRFNDSAVLNSHVQEHKCAEKASPIIRLKLDPIAPAETPGYMYYRQVTSGKVQTIWKCQIASSSGPSNIYVCGICQMKFDSLNAINEHEKIHVQSAAAETEEQTAVEDNTEDQSEDTEDHKDVEETKDESHHSGASEKTEETDSRSTEDHICMQPDIAKQADAVDGDIEAQFGIELVSSELVSSELASSEQASDEIASGEPASDEIASGEPASDEIASGEPASDEIALGELPANEQASRNKVKVLHHSQHVVEQMDTAEAGNEDIDPDESEDAAEVSEPVVQNDKLNVVVSDIKSEAKAFECEAEVGVEGSSEVKYEDELNEETEEEHSEGTDKLEKTKILQCNVPSFLEVSASAEGYGIKEEEKKESEGDKKAAALQFVNCGICNKKLKLQEIKAHLENHDADTNPDGKLFEPCIICKKMIATKDSNEHLKSHSVFELSLAKNILVHNQNQLKRQLVVHKLKESEPKPAKGETIKMFVCNLCNKGFDDCGPLAEHVKQHLKTDDTSAKNNKGKDEDCKDGGIDVDIEADADSKGKRRKPVKANEAKGSKRAKLVEENDSEATEKEDVEVVSGSKKLGSGVETDPKKNSLLAAALSSAPKYGINLPRTIIVSKSTESTAVSASLETVTEVVPSTSTAGNLPSIMNVSHTSVSGSVVSSSAASLLSVSGSAASVSSTSSETPSNGNLGSDSSSLRDSLCLKFPLVLLKSGSEMDGGRAESTENPSNVMKQNSLSVPVVWVRQENQELKLVPMPSALGLGSSGKSSETSGQFLKFASSAQTSSVSGKKVDSSPRVEPITKPPILYAPVTTVKGSSGLQAKLLSSPALFPVSLFTNQSLRSVGDVSKSLEQRHAPGVKGNGTDIPGSETEGKAVYIGQKESKTESQNIIAKLLDSKAKLAGSAAEPASFALESRSKEQGSLEARLSGNDQQKQPPQPSAQGIARNQPIIQSTVSIGQGTTPVKFFPGDPNSPATTQPTPLFFLKRSSAAKSVDPAVGMKLSGDSLITVSLAGTAEKTLAQGVPAKLGRPPIHGNKSLVLPTPQVAMSTKTKVTTVGSVPSPQLSPVAGSQLSPVAGSQLSPVAVSQASLTALKQPSLPLSSVATTLTPGIQLQPNLVSMMIQQLILSQANQAAATSSTTTSLVTSPKPTFNLVIAPQVTSVPALVPSVTTPSPTAVSRAQAPTSAPNSTAPLILVCKMCNQSLDSLGLMGSHVCSKVSKPSAPTSPASGTQKKITLYRCNLCKDNTFTDYSMYMQHAKSHMERTAKKDKSTKTNVNSRTPLLACPLCRDFFNEEEAMTRHIEDKHPEGNIKCKYCDRVSIGKADYELHVLYDHPWQCNKCYHRFSTLGQLTAHVMLDLKSLPALTCIKCSLCFPSIESIVTHMGFAHPDGDSLFNCTNQDTLNAYLQKSKSTCSCTCKTCDAGFRSTEAMTSHVQKVHFTKVIFLCGVCKESKRLPVRSSLDAHQHFNCVSKQDIQFCYQCCLLFPNKWLFNKHNAIHQGVVTDSTKSKLKSVLKDKAKSFDTDPARMEADDLEQSHAGNRLVTSVRSRPDRSDQSVADMMELFDDTVAGVDEDSVGYKDLEEDKEIESDVDRDIDGGDDARTNMMASEPDINVVVDAETVEDSLECSECKLGPFRSKYQLKQHKVIKHLYPRSRTSTSYYQHVIENLKRPKGFECGKCERRFERQSSLFRHQVSHGIRRYACQFADCKLKFATVPALKLHQSKCRKKQRRATTEHSSSGVSEGSSEVVEPTAETNETSGKIANVYMCTVCDKDCEHLLGLKEHIVLEHSNRLGQCNKCQAVFIRETDSQEHSCSKGDDETGAGEAVKGPLKGKKRRLYSCSGCHKSFFKLMKLTKHVWEHEQTKKLARDAELEKVDVTSAGTEGGLSGANKAGEKSEQADICELVDNSEKIFSSELVYISEQVISSEQVDNTEGGGEGQHTAELGWFRCSVCKKVFKESADLYQHVKTHLSPASVASLTRNKLLHAQSVQGNPSQPSADLETVDTTEEGTDTDNHDNAVLNAVICNNCRKIVYFEEDRLCEVVLNHTCSHTGLQLRGVN